MKKKLSIAVVAIVLVAVSALFGCGSSVGTTTAVVPEQSTNQPSAVSDDGTTPDVLTLGVATPGQAPIAIINSTGKDITGISLKMTGEKTFGASLLAGQTTWADAAPININLPVGSDGKASTFDILLKLGNKTKITLHDVQLAGLNDISLKIDKKTELGYLSYKTETGENKSTLAVEKKLKAKEDAAAAKKAAEKAAKAQAKSAASSSKNQSSDSCLDDPVLR
jgi:hypothetical protein